MGKIESRLLEMGRGSCERSEGLSESKVAPKVIPEGETEKGDAGGQKASCAGTFIKSADKGMGSRGPALQKAIEESAKTLQAGFAKRGSVRKEK